MADGTTGRNEVLSKFLATFTTQMHYTIPESSLRLSVFWSQHDQFPNGSTSDDPDPWVIREKIKSAFSMVELSSFDGFIQFWAPVIAGGRCVLTTCDQPFALKILDKGLDKYRLSSIKYKYNVDHVNNIEGEVDPLIISGAPAIAFLNRFPEIVPDMRVHQECAFVLSGLEFGLVASFVLPVFDFSQRCCVGVVDCSLKRPDDLLVILNEFNRELKKVGLRTFVLYEHLPYKIINSVEHVRDTIKDALKIVCESHNLGLAQVWVAYENANQVPFSSSLEVIQPKTMLGLKLMGYDFGLADGGFHFSFKEYYDACDILPLKIEEGLAGKSLQSYEPYFCRNVSRLNDNERVALLPADAECSCFTICLRSAKTGDTNYVFEFLWAPNRNYFILLESILLALKRCLPTFQFASGAELDDQLHVLEVEDSIRSAIGFFKVFEGKRSSQILTALEEEEERRPVVKECIGPWKEKCKTTPIPLPQENIKEQYGKTMKEAAKNLNVSLSTLKRKCKMLGISEWQGPNFLKRKVHDSYDNQNGTNEEYNRELQGPYAINNETCFDENTLTIKAEYFDDMIKFHLPVSMATFVAVEREIGKRFKLNHGDYKVKYQDEDKDWILMNTDQDMRNCMKTFGNVNRIPILLRVQRSERQISSSNGTQAIRLSDSIISNGGLLDFLDPLYQPVRPEPETAENIKKSVKKQKKPEKSITSDVPQKLNATNPDVCPTTMKQNSKQYGITSWPCGKINEVRLKQVIGSLQGTEGTFTIPSLATTPLVIGIDSTSWPTTSNGIQTNQQGSSGSEPYDSQCPKNYLGATNQMVESREASTTSLNSHRSCQGNPSQILTNQIPPASTPLPNCFDPTFRPVATTSLPTNQQGSSGSKPYDPSFPKNDLGSTNKLCSSIEANASRPNSYRSSQDNLFSETESFSLNHSPPVSCNYYDVGIAESQQSKVKAPGIVADFSISDAFLAAQVEEPFRVMVTDQEAGSLHDLTNFCSSENLKKEKQLYETDMKTITIKARYKEDIIMRFRMAANSDIITLKKEVTKRLNLNVGTFDIKYLDDDYEWVLMVCDADLKECVELSRSSRFNIIRLLVVDCSTHILDNLCESSG